MKIMKNTTQKVGSKMTPKQAKMGSKMIPFIIYTKIIIFYK